MKNDMMNMINILMNLNYSLSYKQLKFTLDEMTKRMMKKELSHFIYLSSNYKF